MRTPLADIRKGQVRLKVAPVLWTCLLAASCRWVVNRLPDHNQRRRRRREGHAAGKEIPVRALARSLQHCCRGLGPVSKRALVAGLVKTVRASVQRHPNAANQRGSPTELSRDPEFLEELQHWRAMAEAAYAGNRTEFSLVSNTPVSAIVACEFKPDLTTQRPAFVLVIDPSRRALVLAVRGTADPVDAITDAAAAPVPFRQGGYVHEGLLRAARLVLQQVEDQLRLVLMEYPWLCLVTSGHSMGGSVAALIALHLDEMLPHVDVRGFAYSPAACMSRDLSRKSAGCVTTVAGAHDVVPCLSVLSLDRLCQQLQQLSHTGRRKSKLRQSWRRARDRAAAAADAQCPADEVELFPPGRLLLLGWDEGGEPPRRIRKPRLFLGSYFTRKMGLNWSKPGATCVRWRLTLAQAEDFKNIPLSLWSWADHMLSTTGEGLHAIQLQAVKEGRPLV